MRAAKATGDLPTRLARLAAWSHAVSRCLRYRATGATARRRRFFIFEPLVFTSDNDPDTGPYQGTRRITGKAGATIEVVIVDPLNARLDIDLDGDGTVDDVQTVLWSELSL